MYATHIRYLISLLLCLFLMGKSWSQQERILDYQVDIEVNIDRSIKVTETIEVEALGHNIKRGITRSLPRSLRGRGLQYKILEILKNGSKEPYHTERSGDNLVIYFGEKDIFLDPGIYTYTLVYKVPNQIRLFDDFDEVYWNAVGPDWIFPIEKASCTVRIPSEAQVIQQACYTGVYGSTEKNCTYSNASSDNTISFTSTTSFKAREGFTVAVGFSKDVIQPMTFLQKFGAAIVLGIGSLALLIYYIFTTFKYGIDPPKPTPYPQFQSPNNLSPAAMAYNLKENYNAKFFTSSIINLAVKGYIYIKEEAKSNLFVVKKTYELIRKKGGMFEELSPEEQVLMNNLFAEGDRIVLDGKYDKTLKKALDGHRKLITLEHDGFVKAGYNQNFLAIPILGTIALGALAIWLISKSGGQLGDEGILILFLFFTIIPLYFTIGGLFKKSVKWYYKIWLALFSLIFFSGSGLTLFAVSIQPFRAFLGNPERVDLNLVSLSIFVVFAIISILLYAYIIKKPSAAKQALQSDIEGFQMYLEMAEKDRLNLLNPPDKTPEHFEAMLPFAHALGIAHKWSKSFENVLDNTTYEPKWSNNAHFYHNHSFTSDFNRSVSYSSTPPSSSGSGGGGSSGGGGGGGGGGGW